MVVLIIFYDYPSVEIIISLAYLSATHLIRCYVAICSVVSISLYWLINVPSFPHRRSGNLRSIMNNRLIYRYIYTHCICIVAVILLDPDDLLIQDHEYLRDIPPSVLKAFELLQLGMIVLMFSMNCITEFTGISWCSFLIPALLLMFSVCREVVLPRIACFTHHLDKVRVLVIVQHLPI